MVSEKLREGATVKIHPCCDEWMQGDKSGTVHKVGTKWVHVWLWPSGRIRKFHPENIERV